LLPHLGSIVLRYGSDEGKTVLKMRDDKGKARELGGRAQITQITALRH
jgi:hypothetical protein